MYEITSTVTFSFHLLCDGLIGKKSLWHEKSTPYPSVLMKVCQKERETERWEIWNNQRNKRDERLHRLNSKYSGFLQNVC